MRSRDLLNRQQMLENVRDFWITGVLDNALHGAALLELGLKHRPGSVAHPDMRLRVDGRDESIAPNLSIQTIFDDFDQQLLILGEPGSGKTTLLLELARDLLTRAENDASQPIPVVFNLSSWARDGLPLTEWLVDELNTKYQVARKVAARWVQSDALCLLLDGLDEVAEAHRADCLTTINAFMDAHPHVQMVVCSRAADYDLLTDNLNLHGAVIIQPLTDAQIDRYVDSLGTQMDGLRGLLAGDDSMHELARTPLMLSIMALAYQDMEADDLPEFATMEERRDYLFNIYIDRMLTRRIKTKAYPADDIVDNLSWLAKKMDERGQSVFYIENLQGDWLDTPEQQRQYSFLTRFIYGTGIGAIAGALAMLLVMTLHFVLTGVAPIITRYPADPIIGIPAILLFGVIGGIGGILAGGGVFGATALLAFAQDSLSHARTRLAAIRKVAAITLFAGAAGAVYGLVFGLWLDIMTSNLVMYPYGVSAPLTGLAAYGYLAQLTAIIGLVAGVTISAASLIINRFRWSLSRITHGVVGAALGLTIGTTMMAVFYGSTGSMILPYAVFLLFGGSVGLVVGGFTDKIQSAERLGWRWSWRWAQVGLGIALVSTVLHWINLMTYTSTFNPSFSLLESVLSFLAVVGVFGILAGGVAGGLRKSETVESRTLPNQGIYRTARSILKTTLAFMLAGAGIVATVALTAAIIDVYQDGMTPFTLPAYYIDRILNTLRDAIIIGLGGGLAAGLAFGGSDTVIKHLVLRGMLHRSTDVPRNLARFLDHATSLILLRRVGGGYMFVHRYLLEYFADVEAEKAKHEALMSTRLMLPPGDEDESLSDGEIDMPDDEIDTTRRDIASLQLD